MKYYEQSNLHTLELPDTPLARLAEHYWLPLIQKGVGLALRQVEASCALAVINDKTIPILINENSEHCSIVSSSCYFYLSGSAAYENHKNPCLRLFFKILKLFRLIPRALNFDKNIQINQWLLPTNPLLNLTHEELKEIITHLKNKYPDHAIIYKGLTDEYSHCTLQAALSQGARLVKMRWLYFWDSNKTSKRQLNKIRAKSCPFELTHDLAESQRFLSLYTLLYRKKHSPYSPDYTPYFFSSLIDSQFFKAKIFKIDDKVQAFYFYCDNGPFLELGIIGYDTDQPKSLGLYSCLMNSVTSEFQVQEKPICLGAGSGEYKRQRGGYPVTEYDAVFVNHLPIHRRVLWLFFSKTTQSSLMDYFLKDS